MASHLFLAWTTSWAKTDTYFLVLAVLNYGVDQPACSINSCSFHANLKTPQTLEKDLTVS